MAHANNINELQRRGFNVSEVRDTQLVDYRVGLEIKLGADPTLSLSQEELIRAIFRHLYSQHFEHNIPNEAYVSDMFARFQRIGREAGFVELVRSISGQTPNAETFKRVLLERIEQI